MESRVKTKRKNIVATIHPKCSYIGIVVQETMLFLFLVISLQFYHLKLC